MQYLNNNVFLQNYVIKTVLKGNTFVRRNVVPIYEILIFNQVTSDICHMGNSIFGSTCYDSIIIC